MWGRLIGDDSVNVKEIQCGNVGVEEDGGYKRQSACLSVMIGGDVDADDGRFSTGEEINQILREELGSANITSAPNRAAWPIYTKRRSSVLSEQDKPLCKAVMFVVAIRLETVGVVELSRGKATNSSEGVPESFVASGRFSTLEGIAQRQVDEGFLCSRMDGEGEGIVRFPPVDEMFGQESLLKERLKYYPSQSAKSLLKDFFQPNPPTHLDPSHPTTSFSSDQMIQFTRAVGLEVWLASYKKLDGLLLNARGGSGAFHVTSRYAGGKSLFPSVAGSSVGDSVASRSVYSSPIFVVRVEVLTLLKRWKKLPVRKPRYSIHSACYLCGLRG